MAYIGKVPSAVPLSGADIPANSIDASKLVDGSITIADIADDAVTEAKLANAINSAIAANTAKTGITSGQASAITANTAKTGITTAQANAITANTAKTGITSGQASAITANTAKVTNSTSASDLTSGTLPMARLSGTLPALNGSALTNLPAQTLSGLSDTTISTSNPTRTTNPSAVGHLWLNKTSGGIYVCTDVTSNANVWIKSGDGEGGVGVYTYDIFGDSSATALWTLDGHTNDYGGSYNGTNNAMTFNTGKSSASGDGGTVSGNGVAMTTSMSVQPPFSISFWLKTSGVGVRNTILMQFGNF